MCIYWKWRHQRDLQYLNLSTHSNHIVHSSQKNVVKYHQRISRVIGYIKIIQLYQSFMYWLSSNGNNLQLRRVKQWKNYLNSASFVHIISISYELLRHHTIKMYCIKHLKNRSHTKRVPTRIINENLIIIVDLKITKISKLNSFSQLFLNVFLRYMICVTCLA